MPTQIDYFKLADNRAEAEAFLDILDRSGVPLLSNLHPRCVRCGAPVIGGPKKIHCSARCKQAMKKKRGRQRQSRPLTVGQ